MNRVIQAQLAPGSVFKIITATAMLESKGVPETFTAFCPGQATFYGRVFHCWQPKGHGTVNLEQAIAESCDVFFYNVGMRLGIDACPISDSGVGLGKRTGIDLPSEEARPDAQRGMGAARAASGVVSGRNNFCCHRSGSNHDDAAAACAKYWRHCAGRSVQSSASAEITGLRLDRECGFPFQKTPSRK